MWIKKLKIIFIIIYLCFFTLFFVSFANTEISMHAESDNAIAPDQYEPDNTFTEATLIDITRPETQPQLHNFYARGDKDWIKFYGIPDIPYTINVTSPGPRCDPVIELYDRDGTTLLISRDRWKEG